MTIPSPDPSQQPPTQPQQPQQPVTSPSGTSAPGSGNSWWTDIKTIILVISTVLGASIVVIDAKSNVARIKDSFDDTKARMKEQLDDVKKQVENANGSASSLGKDVSGLREAVNNSNRDLADAKTNYGSAVKAIEEAKRQLETVPAVISQAKNELKQTVDSLNNDVEKLMLEQMPIGSILIWPLASNPPPKWRVCDGSIVTPNEAPEFCLLFGNSKWATEQGKVVHTPDLQGYFVRGADLRKKDDPQRIDEDAPRSIGSVQAEKFPEHSHGSSLRIAGGLWHENGKKMLLYKDGGAMNLQGGPGEPFHDSMRSMWSGGGEPNTEQLHGGTTNVDTIAIDGAIGGVTGKTGESHPANVALQFIIRVIK